HHVDRSRRVQMVNVSTTFRSPAQLLRPISNVVLNVVLDRGPLTRWSGRFHPLEVPWQHNITTFFHFGYRGVSERLFSL
ncbi:hypothetical protein, partial [Gordonia neofelifaecis]|uniref:hypothetical protein n=1 Tax=Gordonia neofelifaecis TaxID=945692 RepID=UPI001EE67FAC